MFSPQQALRNVFLAIALIVVCGLPGTLLAATDVFIENIDSARFPTIYSNVTVTSDGVVVADLTADNFDVFEDGVTQVIEQVTPPGSTAGDRRADVVFLVDASGSMGGEIADVRANINAFADALAASNVNFALGLVRFGYGSGPNPYIYNEGNLTSDIAEFQSLVATLRASGGYEPGFLALREAAKQFVFRAGAQKVFVIITDEDSDDRNKADTIALLQALNVTVHAAVQCNFGASNSDYCDDTSVRAATGGLLFGVQGPYGPILDTIAEATAATYIIRYTTNNPVNDGIEREVVIEAVADGSVGTDVGYYTPGSAPQISLTDETLDLMSNSWLEGTSLTISAHVEDLVLPDVIGARLYFRAGEPANQSFTSVGMSEIAPRVWSAAIPSFAVLYPRVEFYVTATDGQSTSSYPRENPDGSPLHIAILPNEAPQITYIAPPMPLAPHPAGQPLNVRADIADSTNELKAVAVYYRQKGDLGYQKIDVAVPVGAQSLLLDLDIPAVSGDALEFYIAATDDLGTSRFFPIGGGDEPIEIKLVGKRSQALFIHGIMLSELFEGDGVSSDDEKRWFETNDKKHISRLEVDQDGRSINSIYVREGATGLLKEALTLNIYKTFINNTLNKDEFRDWDAFSYDWRSAFGGAMSLLKEGQAGNAQDTAIMDALQEKIEELAARDPRGKVDVVAHSMGGLLAKYYISLKGAQAKIDKLILLNSPQLGTATGAFVPTHGWHSLARGPLKAETMRRISRYAASTYYLTPALKYFDTNTAKTIPLFSMEVEKEECASGYDINFDSKFPGGVNTYKEWDSFFSDPGLIGTKNVSDCTSWPDECNRPLAASDGMKSQFQLGYLTHALKIGSDWDSHGVKVYQIVGQNLQTTAGLKYMLSSKKRLIGIGCDAEWEIESSEEAFGDGTVVRESQETLPVTTYYIDLQTYNCTRFVNRSHASILEVGWVRAQIESILKGSEALIEVKSQTCSSALATGFPEEPVDLTSKNQPISRPVQWVKFTIKSPVEAHVYDSRGNHTGPVGDWIETSVPNTKYLRFGERKILILPLGYDDLSVEFRGTGEGMFSLRIERYDHAELVQTLDFLNMPVTPEYRGRIRFKDFNDISVLEADQDGNGEFESAVAQVGNAVGSSRGAHYLSGGYRAVATFDVRMLPKGVGAEGWLKFSSADAAGRKEVVISKPTSVSPTASDHLAVKAPCVFNGQAGYDCTIGIFDGGTPGAGKDFFSIKVTGPNEFSYRSSGTLTGGDLSVMVQ